MIFKNRGKIVGVLLQLKLYLFIDAIVFKINERKINKLKHLNKA